jgi:Thermophilic metalloprotease (M29)
VNETDYVRRLAELVVKFGANVQPGQIVALSTEPGKEPLARAVAEVAYEQGAKFVDLRVFDVYLKRARALNADPDTLGSSRPGTETKCALSASTAARLSRSPGRWRRTSWMRSTRSCWVWTCFRESGNRHPERTDGVVTDCRSPRYANARSPGEVPERLNGRDWKSRNGG